MTDPDAIAKRAYELFLARGSMPGHEMEDWLQAEAELNAKAGDSEEDHQAQETGDEAEPAVDQDRDPRDRRASRKRSGGSRRVARQPQTH